MVYKILDYVDEFRLRSVNKMFYDYFTRTPITTKIQSCVNILDILNKFAHYKNVFVDFVNPEFCAFQKNVLLYNIYGFGVVLNDATQKETCTNPLRIKDCCYPKIKKIKLDIANYHKSFILTNFPNVCELELICGNNSYVSFGVYPTITKLTITNRRISFREIFKVFPNLVELNETFDGNIKISSVSQNYQSPKKYNISVGNRLIYAENYQPEVLHVRANTFEIFNYNMFNMCQHLSILPQFSSIDIIYYCDCYPAPVLQTLEIVDTADITFICPPLEKLTIHFYSIKPYINSICKMLMFYKPKKCYLVIENDICVSDEIVEFLLENNVKIIMASQ